MEDAKAHSKMSFLECMWYQLLDARCQNIDKQKEAKRPRSPPECYLLYSRNFFKREKRKRNKIGLEFLRDDLRVTFSPDCGGTWTGCSLTCIDGVSCFWVAAFASRREGELFRFDVVRSSVQDVALRFLSTSSGLFRAALGSFLRIVPE